ncbi:MAG: hypothetical protein ACTHLO_05460 [Pseudolabrys sp.]
MKLILPAMAVLAATLLCAPAQAQTSSEQAGQQACGNDAFSLCGDAIPDRGRIEACLRRNYSRVSAGCKAYMASFGRSHRVARAERHHYRHGRTMRRHHVTHHKTTRHHTKRRHHTD